MQHEPISRGHWLLRFTFWLTAGVRLFDMGCGGGHPPMPDPVPDASPKADAQPVDIIRTDI